MSKRHGKIYCVILIIAFIILMIVTISLYRYYFATDMLFFLKNDDVVVWTDSYEKFTAVVSDSGDCYIRGYPVSTAHPYGVKEIQQYNNQYNSLDPNKPDRFVRIYNKKNAVNIKLSENGGAIVNTAYELYVFAPHKGYETPAYFCENVLKAQLFENKVFILTKEGQFGYREISTPTKFVKLEDYVADFVVAEAAGSIWHLTRNKELWVHDAIDYNNSGVRCAAEVRQFTVLCTENNPRLSRPRYSLGYVNNMGNAYYYNGYGIPGEGEFVCIMQEGVQELTAYSEGVFATNYEGDAFAFGSDLFGGEVFEGDLILGNIASVSAGLYGINFVTQDGRMIHCGEQPSSEVVLISEVRDMQGQGDGSKTGDGSLSSETPKK